MNDDAPVTERLAWIRHRIEEACRRGGRPAGGVILVGASKTQAPARLAEAWEAGLRVFGENRVQEALGKSAELSRPGYRMAPDRPAAEQQGPAGRRALPGRSLHRPAEHRRGPRPRGGRARQNARRFPGDQPRRRSEQARLRSRGAGGRRPPAGRPHPPAPRRPDGHPASGGDSRGFPPVVPQAPRAARRPRRPPRVAGFPGWLSMGMSDDFEVAVEEGATHVRVGTALFGPRRVP